MAKGRRPKGRGRTATGKSKLSGAKKQQVETRKSRARSFDSDPHYRAQQGRKNHH